MASCRRFIFLLVASSYLVVPVAARNSSLKVGFYRRSCPNAQRVVRKAVREAASRDSGITAALPRMHFHDCFVRVIVGLRRVGAPKVFRWLCGEGSPGDPSMDDEYANFLKTKCPRPRGNGRTGPDPTVPLDLASPRELRNKRGLLTSDQALQSGLSTSANARDNESWAAAKFAKAMVRMGSIEVMNRRKCSVVN